MRYINSIFVIKYSLSYKHISRGHIRPYYVHSLCINTDTLLPISAQRMNYSDFHKNRMRNISIFRYTIYYYYTIKHTQIICCFHRINLRKYFIFYIIL